MFNSSRATTNLFYPSYTLLGSCTYYDNLQNKIGSFFVTCLPGAQRPLIRAPGTKDTYLLPGNSVLSAFTISKNSFYLNSGFLPYSAVNYSYPTRVVLAYNHDQTKVALTVTSTEIGIYDVATQQPLYSIDGSGYSFYGAEWSPDGNYLVVFTSRTSTLNVFVYDTSDFSLISGGPSEYPVGSVNCGCFSPDGTRFIMGGTSSPYLTFYDTSNWSKITSPITATTQGTVYDIEYNNAGTYLAIAFSSSPGHSIHRVSDWSSITSPITGRYAGFTVKFSPNDEYLAYTHTLLSSRNLSIIKTSDWSEINHSCVDADLGSTAGADFNSTSTELVLSHSGSEKSIRVIQMSDPADVTKHIFRMPVINAQWASTNGIISKDRNFYVWNETYNTTYIHLTRKDGTLLNSWGTLSGLYSVDLAPNFSNIIFGKNASSYFGYIPLPNGSITYPAAQPSSTCVIVKYKPDSTQVAIALSGSPGLAVYNTSNWTLKDLTGQTPTGGCADIAFNGNSMAALIVNSDPRVRIYSIDGSGNWTYTGEPYNTGTHPTSTAYCAAFSPNGNYLAVGLATKAIVYNTSDWSLISLPTPDPGYSISAIVFSPDGNYLIIGLAQGLKMLWVYNVSDWSVRSKLPNVTSNPLVKKVYR